MTGQSFRNVWALAVACVCVFAFGASFYAWTHNTHEFTLRADFPTWFMYGYPLFDGYGDYAAAIRHLLQNPLSGWTQFLSFLRGYFHSNTPLFPLVAAVFSLGGIGILWSCFLTTLLSSVACLLLFHRLLLQRDPGFGTPAKLCFIGFALHVPNLSGWCRPLPDTMALAIIIGFFVGYRQFRDTHRKRWLWFCVGCCVVGVFAKTLVLLLLPLLVLLLVRDLIRRSELRRKRRVRMAVATLLFLLTAIVLTGALYGNRMECFRFIYDSTHNAYDAWRSIPDPMPIVRAGVLFLFLAFGLYPLLTACGLSRRLVGGELEHFAWIAIYLLQRLWHASFNMGYGRARYGIPLAASVLILALPGVQRLWPHKAGRVLACVPVITGLVVWGYFLATLR